MAMRIPGTNRHTAVMALTSAKENGGEGDYRVELEPALQTRQERRAGDGAETEAAEQKTVAQRAEAEVPARDYGE